MAELNWLLMIVVGVLVYIFTMTPICPPEWKRAISALGGVLILIGVIVLLFVLFSGETVDV